MLGNIYNKLFQSKGGSVEEAIVSVVRKFGGSEGISLDAIKKHLSSILGKTPDMKSVQSALNNALKKGFVSVLDNGNYKATETSEQKEETSPEYKYYATIDSTNKEPLSKMNFVTNKNQESKQNSSSKISDEQHQTKRTETNAEDSKIYTEALAAKENETAPVSDNDDTDMIRNVSSDTGSSIKNIETAPTSNDDDSDNERRETKNI